MVVKYGIIWWFHGISRGYFMSLFHGIEWWSNRDSWDFIYLSKMAAGKCPARNGAIESWETWYQLIFHFFLPESLSKILVWMSRMMKNHRWIWGPVFGAPVVRKFEICQYRGWSGSGLEKVQIFVKLQTRPADWITPWLAGWVFDRDSTWWRYLELSFHSVHWFFPSDFIMNLWYATVPVLKGFHICCYTLCTCFCSSNSKGICVKYSYAHVGWLN